MFRKQKTNLKKNISKQNTHFFLFHSWACLPSLRDTNRLFLHCRRQVRGPSLRRTTDQKCHSRGKNTSSNNHKKSTILCEHTKDLTHTEHTGTPNLENTYEQEKLRVVNPDPVGSGTHKKSELDPNPE